MRSELESHGDDRAIVINLERFGVDGVGYDDTETLGPSRQVRQTRSEDHVSGHSDCAFPAWTLAVFVFITLVFADMISVDASVDSLSLSDLQCTGTDLPGGTRLFPAIS